MLAPDSCSSRPVVASVFDSCLCPHSAIGTASAVAVGGGAAAVAASRLSAEWER